MSDVCRYFGAQWNGVVKSSPLESDNQEAGSLLTLRRYSQPAPNIHSLKCTFGKKKKKKKIQDLPLLILKTPDRKNFLSRCTHTPTHIHIRDLSTRVSQELSQVDLIMVTSAKGCSLFISQNNDLFGSTAFPGWSDHWTTPTISSPLLLFFFFLPTHHLPQSED